MNVRFYILITLIVISCDASAESENLTAELSDVHGVSSIQMHAVGAQIYECRQTNHNSLEWSFREPIATLMTNGKSIGVHYAGPSWRLRDGSSVQGAVVRQAPGKTSHDIPWLELMTTQHSGRGALDNVTSIRRIDTKGGEISGLCSPEGSFASIPYEAEYIFIKS